MSSGSGSWKDNADDGWVLSTSFEKTCMRQIHCLDRLSALVNKGPYHAQGLFPIIATSAKASRVSKKIQHVAAIESVDSVCRSCHGKMFSAKEPKVVRAVCRPGQRAKSIRTEAWTRDLSHVRRASKSTRPFEQSCGVSGFRSQYLVLAKDARFQLRQYPCTTPRGFEPLRSKTTHLAGEPLNHSGKVSFRMPIHGCRTEK